jgi:hypothetical protein
MLKVVYAGETFPSNITKTLFLAGPSPRNDSHENWREDALQILGSKGYDGHVFVPLPRDGVFPKDYNSQANWEQTAMNRSDVILFWVPRDLENLPAFTTNVEFGQKVKNRNVVYGHP